ncbi:hypothetical protein [Serratia sp. Se-RSBMAAmG]|uniref:hypothetical protein n=1 Tax=Serratia sp. Se-RSBMAAmG TaxID=3043305 RepID=UPI0024AFB114|nr:hypothetical protein [Serratia sp. Se-RSBMAAmG]MDI6976658.1 hypothetical protein [Serratia sp. Se-RSBMAAmG]
MGGNALKEVRTRRLDREEFEQCEKNVVIFLKENFPTAMVDSIPSYREKSTFGDLDVLISEEGLKAHGGIEKLIEKAQETFFSRQEKANGHVLSFEYRTSPEQERGFQVDVLQMAEVTLDYAKNYFSYNDLGNLVGRSAHKMGLKFGHNGLWYVMRDGDHKLADILLTRDFDKSLSFMGFDPKRFREGFENLEEVYEYVGGSKYFDGNIYLMENQSYKYRVRDKKRPTYQQFLQWIRDNDTPSVFTYPQDKAEWLPKIFEAFPEFKKNYDLTLKNYDNILKVREKFNSELMSEWSGKTGQALGFLTQTVKDSFANDIKMMNFILDKSTEEIKAFVLDIDSKVDYSGYDTISPEKQEIIDQRKARQAAKKELKQNAAIRKSGKI